MSLKKFILFFVLGIGMIGCETNENTSSVKYKKIILTAEEKKQNKDEIARILVNKALIIEAENAQYTPEELENIKKAQDLIKVNYLLDREVKSKINVTDKEVQDYYEKNKRKFDDKTLEETLPILYQNLAAEKFSKVQVGYYNSIIEKYKLNDILREEGIIEEDKPIEKEKAKDK